MAAVDYKVILTKNDCYKAGVKIKPTGIVVHSTGCNNPTLRRYVAPDNGYIGKNAYNNDWNRSGLDVCVHAFIGQDKNGAVKTVQTLPFDMKCWGVGVGSKGSYNASHIQFEMCEDGQKDKAYCVAVYNKAVEFCAYLCKTYGIPVKNIVGHYEAHQQGYGSDHSDPSNWWKYHGLTMDGFRAAVTKALGGTASAATTPTTTTTTAKTETATLKANYLGKSGYNNVAVQVKTVQRLLNALGYKGKDGKALAVDGDFGVNTEYAVIAFQKAKKVDADGVVGVVTWRLLTGAK